MFKYAVLVTGSLLMSAISQAEDWPRFLGPNGTGVSPEKNLVDEIPVTGPKFAWRTALGVGMSNVAVLNGTVYTMFQDDAQQYLAALNEEDGTQKWKVPIAPAYENSMGNGPRATPTVTTETAYVFTGDGVLAAVRLKDQKLAWRVDTCASLAGKPADYGMASSPLLVNDLVVVHVGTVNGSVVAYDAKSGEQAWTVGSNPNGYSSPALLKIGGVSQVVSMTGNAVLSLSPKDGEKLWSLPFETDYRCNTANPVSLTDDTILVSAGENHGSVVLKVSQADGEWDVKQIFASEGRNSVLRAEWQTPILHDGHIYGFDNVGSAGAITNLVCLNAETYEQVWIQKRFGKGNFTLADGKLFLSTIRGELVIVKATPDGFKELARHVVLNGMTRQAPAIANGRLYLRDDKEVVCIDVRK